MIIEADSKAETLELGRIALWYKGTTTDDQTKAKVETITTGIVRASVPILQRGLVWRPQQIEMLWDSLFRGFPIGALVVCPKIKGQVKKSDDDVTHHILDGQQRCNAICLGFTDPFSQPEAFQPRRGERDQSVLWLDLNPELREESTRGYLARLTNSAHPWGYWKNDNADRISADDKRKALDAIGKSPEQQGYKRPGPREMSPYFSNAPVPLGWLMSAPISSSDAFWEHVKARLEVMQCTGLMWVNKAIGFIGNDQSAQKKKHIFDGICRARNATIVALMAPKELLDETVQEARDNGLEIARNLGGISNIEHLFQRLNQQGTQLNGEELAYSMIKAYWPELAESIDNIKPRHMPSSRIVSLAVRLALASDTKDRLPSTLGVSQIRAMAKKKDTRITDFIIGKEAEEYSPLFRASIQVDEWLKYSSENPSGFLPVHITRFAMGSPDVYLLLLWMAHSTMGDTKTQQSLRKPAQALTSWIHWFALDKGKAVNCIYAECKGKNSFSPGTLKEAIRLALAKDNSLLAVLPSKEHMIAFMMQPQSNIDDWNWWNLVNDTQGQIDELRKQILEQVVYRILGNKEILLYVQREYLNGQFDNYDPSDTDMWQDYNSPWDYDHILPHSCVYNRKGWKFQKFCTKWVNTIGNLRAWPAEENRSWQAESAVQKISTDDIRRNSFLLLAKDEDGKSDEERELKAFSAGDKVLDDPKAALHFANACWFRIVRIYGEWYDCVRIADLLPETLTGEMA
jgi:hypothetical protein